MISVLRNNNYAKITMDVNISSDNYYAGTIPPKPPMRDDTIENTTPTFTKKSPSKASTELSISPTCVTGTDNNLESVLRKQVAELAGRVATKRFHEIQHNSQLMIRSSSDRNTSNNGPLPLSWDDVFVEDMLGMGGFASVCLVTCPKLRKKHEKEIAGHDRPSSFQESNSTMHSSYSMHCSESSDEFLCDSSMMMSYASTVNTGETSTIDPMKYYACKSLSNKTIQQANVRGFVGAAADLVQEAFLLSYLSPHPNIVRLYGTPDCDIDMAFNCSSSTDEDDNELGYFLVMEALTGGVLNEKISDWRETKMTQRKQQQQQQQLNSNPNNPQHDSSLSSFLKNKRVSSASKSMLTSVSSLSTTHNPTIKSNGTKSSSHGNIPSLVERLDIALQIALGMNHLHSHNIIFRDLKPNNVGLSSRPPTNNNNTNHYQNGDGEQQPQPKLTWRLFDFGLAREVPSKSSIVNGKSGSLRYMAPETMGGKWLRRTSSSGNDVGCFATYGSDVYGFGILVWELIGLEDFDHRYDCHPAQFEEAVCDHNYRPDISVIDDQIKIDDDDSSSNNVGAALRSLLESCWDEDYRNRPTFQYIISILQELITSVSSTTSVNDSSSNNGSRIRRSMPGCGGDDGNHPNNSYGGNGPIHNAAATENIHSPKGPYKQTPYRSNHRQQRRRSIDRCWNNITTNNNNNSASSVALSDLLEDDSYHYNNNNKTRNHTFIVDKTIDNESDVETSDIDGINDDDVKEDGFGGEESLSMDMSLLSLMNGSLLSATTGNKSFLSHTKTKSTSTPAATTEASSFFNASGTKTTNSKNADANNTNDADTNMDESMSLLQLMADGENTLMSDITTPHHADNNRIIGTSNNSSARPGDDNVDGGGYSSTSIAINNNNHHQSGSATASADASAKTSYSHSPFANTTTTTQKTTGRKSTGIGYHQTGGGGGRRRIKRNRSGGGSRTSSSSSRGGDGSLDTYLNANQNKNKNNSSKYGRNKQ